MKEKKKLKWNTELIIIPSQFLYYCILVPEFNILANLITIHPALGRRILMNSHRFNLLHFSLLGPYMYPIPVLIGLLIMELAFSYASSLSDSQITFLKWKCVFHSPLGRQTEVKLRNNLWSILIALMCMNTRKLMASVSLAAVLRFLCLGA